MPRSAQEVCNFYLPDYIVIDIDNYMGCYTSGVYYSSVYDWTDFNNKSYRFLNQPSNIAFHKSTVGYHVIEYKWFDSRHITRELSLYSDDGKRDIYYKNGLSDYMIRTEPNGIATKIYL
jgi:hypothetical protein